jgi:hypothetical protein
LNVVSLPTVSAYSEFCIRVDGKTFGIMFLSLSEATEAALGLQAQGKKCEIFRRESGKVVIRFDRHIHGKTAAVSYGKCRAKGCS